MADHVSSPPPLSIDNPHQTRSVLFSPSEIQRLQAQHTLSLYAKILGRKVRYDHFYNHIHNLFNLVGTLEVISLRNEFFLLRFSEPTDYLNALLNGPWTINYNYIALLPWTPNFKPSESSVSRTKVWIRLYELPVEYYDKEALSRIAQEIAPLVKIDPVTESMSKCKFARFCVDLDLKHKFLDSVKLPNGFSQQIKYEGLRYYQCWGCKYFGHGQKDCPESRSIVSQPVRVMGLPSVVGGSMVSGAGGSITPPCDAAPESAATLSKIEVPEQEGTFHDSGAPCFDDNYLPNLVNKPERSYSTNVGLSSLVSQSEKRRIYSSNVGLGSSVSQNRERRSYSIDMGLGCSVSQNEESVGPMSSGSRMKHQAILRGVKKQEVELDPVEFQEISNAGLPRVISIDKKVCTFSINVMIYSSGNGNLYRNILAPIEIDHTPSAASTSADEHFVLFFNCRGARDPPVVQALKDLVEIYGFSVVVLTETKTYGVEAGKVIGELGFTGKFIIEPVENSGGVWLMWDENQINVMVQGHDQHCLYALAQGIVPGEDLGESWLDVGVYGVDG